VREKFTLLILIIILLTSNFSAVAELCDSYIEPDNTKINSHQEQFKTNIPIENHLDQKLIGTQIAFTENHGQVGNDKVRYYVQGGGIWFTDDGVWIEVRDELSMTSQQSTVYSPESRISTGDRRLTTSDNKRVLLKQEFVGANQVQPIGKEQLGWNCNYFYGNDPEKWCTDVPNFAIIFYENLYPGIDLRYYTHESGLKYDFMVHPGADFRQIRIRYEGAERLEVDNSGNLIIQTKIKNIVDGELFIYQDFDGGGHQVIGSFEMHNSMEYGFKILDDYDQDKLLIIDPIIWFPNWAIIGGVGNDQCYAIAADEEGNSIITGFTNSSNYPVSLGAYDETYNGNKDIFIIKLNVNKTKLIYSTYLGGGNDDWSLDIKLDRDGNSYITGNTSSGNFPTTENAYDRIHNGLNDVFAAKLNVNGSKLLYSTYIGENNNDHGRSIAIDPKGNAFITGWTASANFPTMNAYDSSHNGKNDILVFKIDPFGSSLLFSTFIGKENDDVGYDVAIDNNGNAFITGYTESNNFPITPGAYDSTHNGNIDAFILNLTNDGSKLLYST
jgi:hypothetical protein